MNRLSAFILYNEEDIAKNQWFINHTIELLKKKNCNAKLLTTGEITSIIYNGTSDADIIADISNRFLQVNLPDFVINRSRDSQLSALFESVDIPVYNNSYITKIANDKDLAFQTLANKNIDFLPYIVIPFDYINSEDVSPVTETAKSFGYPFILKPAEGHGGFHVKYISNQNDLINEINELRKEQSQSGLKFKKILIQKPADTLGKDLRVYVLGGKIIASIMRRSEKDFRANFSIGGKSENHILSDKELTLVKKIIYELPADFYGIDFIYNEDTPLFNELEDAVGCRMVYANTDIDILEMYVNYIIKK